MRLKERVMQLLEAGDERGLENLVRGDRRAVRPLFGRLWDPDERVRRRAARAIGVAAEAHPDLGRRLAQNVYWSVQDEAATNGVYGLPAMGEIGYRAPELIEPFVGPLAALVWDDGLRSAVLQALGRIAEIAPAMVRERAAHLVRHEACFTDDERRKVRRLLETTEGGSLGTE